MPPPPSVLAAAAAASHLTTTTTSPPPAPPPNAPPPAVLLAAAAAATKKRAAAAATGAASSATKPSVAAAAGGGGSAPKKLKAATSPTNAKSGASKQQQQQQQQPIKTVDADETMFQRSLRNLGKSDLGDLLQLIDALVEHRKRGESSATARDFLQRAMADKTKWSGDYCASLLVPIYATQNSNTDNLDDVSMQNLSSRNTSARDLIERFLRPNWWGGPATSASAAPSARAPSPPPTVETGAFALWATNQYASTTGSPEEAETPDALLRKWSQLPLTTKMHFETLASQEQRMREAFAKTMAARKAA